MKEQQGKKDDDDTGGVDITEAAVHLGDDCDHLKRYDEAEFLLKNALEVREGALGKDSPEVMKAATLLAHVYQHEGRDDLAKPLLKRAARIDKKNTTCHQAR